MKCYQAKAGELAQHWYVIDAEGMVVGRLAAQIAPILMGKHRPTYTPHIDTGDFVIVTNVDKVVFTGEKWRQKFYQRYSGYPGGQKDEAAWKLFQRRPERILELAVQRMMPKSKIGRHMLAKLKLYVGANHPHQAQQPIPLQPLSGRPTPAGAVFVTPPGPKKNGTPTNGAAKTEPAPAAATMVPQVHEVEAPTAAPVEAAAPDSSTAPVEAAAPDSSTAPVEAAAPDSSTAPVEAATPASSTESSES